MKKFNLYCPMGQFIRKRSYVGSPETWKKNICSKEGDIIETIRKPLLSAETSLQIGWLVGHIKNNYNIFQQIELTDYTFLENKGVKITLKLNLNKKAFRLEKTDCLFCGLDHDINSNREYVSYKIYMKHISIIRVCPHCGAKQVFKYPYPKDMNFEILKHLSMFYIDNGWLDLYGPPTNTIYEGQFVDDQEILRCTEISASI
jgi:hypothetical protein